MIPAAPLLSDALALEAPAPSLPRTLLRGFARVGSVLVLLVGAPGTGKSRLARRLANHLDAQVVESDRRNAVPCNEPLEAL